MFTKKEKIRAVYQSAAFRRLVDEEFISLEYGGYYTDVHADTYYVVDAMCSGSDYSGSDVTESNYRSLLRDYPQFLHDVTPWRGHSPYGVSVTKDFGVEDPEGAHALIDVLLGLKHEYPLYDEEDSYELVHERAEEAWDGWLESDLNSEVQKLTGIPIDELDKERVWEVFSEHEVYPEAEGHRDVYFPGMGDDHVKRAVAAAHVDKFDRDDLEDATDYGLNLLGSWLAEEYGPLEGQMTVFGGAHA